MKNARHTTVGMPALFQSFLSSISYGSSSMSIAKSGFKLIRVFLIIFLTIAFTIPEQGEAHALFHRHRRPYALSANTALLWDPAHNQRYFDLGADRQVFPASTTKVLTVLLVLENLPLDKYVPVSVHATQVPQTKLGLRAGESYSVRDLLYGLILKSANDAAVVLAEAVAGSEPKFVDMMNAKAKQLGANNSFFANPHGLPSKDKQFTTAADMALIFSQTLKNPFFRQALTYKYLVINSKEGHRCFLKSHNKILFANWKRPVYGKTGWTIEAQGCFVGYIPKGNDIFIIAVYGCGCHSRWRDMKYIIEHYGHIDL
ncbi:MAG: D-alanyl-D-alanine carboxypeptidase [Candidatus Omnitrophica bacterium]|nr:D-alanyl-D-alanine carboxypeptidase [Candidatus Omnitrophota bacterium]